MTILQFRGTSVNGMGCKRIDEIKVVCVPGFKASAPDPDRVLVAEQLVDLDIITG
jgi:hypothetical protein